jgi:flagellar biosynthetic protein FlhB
MISESQFKYSQLIFDLQLFSGEKTEDATEKRKREALEKGNVAKSQDMASVVVLLIGLIMLRNYGGSMFSQIGAYGSHVLTNSLIANAKIVTANETITMFAQFLAIVVKALIPLLFAIAIGGIAINLYQTGFILTAEPLMPKFDKLNPINGMKNVFSMKTVVEVLKSIFKILVVIYIPYSTILEKFPMFIRFVKLDVFASFSILGDMIFDMAIRILMVLLALAIADFYFQKWKHAKDMKMSKQEIKDEYKQQEGDPTVKQKIKEIQRKASTKQQLSEVPQATVVVTNPTHIAVALKYEMGQKSAPLIVAMGTGFIAQKIREVATEHNVPIVENKPLARELLKKSNVGDEIPQELWQTVIEILIKIQAQKRQQAA